MVIEVLGIIRVGGYGLNECMPVSNIHPGIQCQRQVPSDSSAHR